jgi:hypothetical protein
VGADVAAAFNPELPRQFILPEYESVPTRKSQILKFCQCSKTSVVHFLFSLLRIKGLYMFRALLAHLQEALYKRRLVYLRACCVSWQQLLVISQVFRKIKLNALN